MIEKCRYCGSGNVAPVLDRNIEKSPKPGNKYRTACLDCEVLNLPVTSGEDWETHPNAQVLPDGAASDDVGALVPAEEADVTGWSGPDRAATDGGDRELEDDAEQEQEQPVNRFRCPEGSGGCGEVVEGRPDECPHCGAPYQW